MKNALVNYYMRTRRVIKVLDLLRSKFEDQYTY